MSNFICETHHIIECFGICPYKLTLENCILFNLNNNSVLGYTNEIIIVELLNCIILIKYNENDQIKIIDCKIVEYDDSYITLYPHYTNGIYCIGPGNVEENEKSCDSGECVDKMCNKTIGFPDDVFPYTTICHKCTNTFSETEQFTESKKFSKTEQFTESKKFSKTETIKFSASKKFTTSLNSNDFSSIESTFSESLSYKITNENDKNNIFDDNG